MSYRLKSKSIVNSSASGAKICVLCVSSVAGNGEAFIMNRIFVVTISLRILMKENLILFEKTISSF